MNLQETDKSSVKPDFFSCLKREKVRYGERERERKRKAIHVIPWQLMCKQVVKYKVNEFVNHGIRLSQFAHKFL